MPITWLDLLLLGVMLISGLLAMIRGFMREVLSIAAWAAAAVATVLLYPKLLPIAKANISSDFLAIGAVIGGTFLLTPDPTAPGPCSVPALGRASTIFQLCVDDIDDVVDRAVNAGATIRTPVEDADWGDRVATIIDPFGHIWALASINREISVAEFNARGNVQLIEAA